MDSRLGKSVRRLAMALLVAAGLASGAANAAFIDLGNGVILDTTTNLEWQQNANNGPVDWSSAWVLGDSLSDAGGGWHLATIDELAGLYQSLINEGFCTGADCTGDIGGFTGIQTIYWSSTEINDTIAWAFFFSSGGQVDGLKDEQWWAWAVRPGDVAAVPAPGSLALLGLGLLALGFARRRRQQ